MDWHDSSCRRLDETRIGSLVTCLSCGSSTTLFEYPPIDKRHGEIRLLRIQDDMFHEPIQCEMTVELLKVYRGSHWGDFEAVSYTWADESGDSSPCRSIFINSTPFPVTKNCEMALKRVRQRQRERASKWQVWIDAVCIDQENDTERGHQVRLMPDIYSRAKTVLVYVGEDDEERNISSALKAIGKVQAGNGNGNAPDILEAALNRIGRPPGASVFQARRDMIRQGLSKLWSRRFFSRAWVLQEVALARMAELLCDDTTIPWRYIQPTHLRTLNMDILEPTRSDDSPIIVPIPPPALYFDHNAFTNPDRLLDLLEFASRCQAKDPRDKVYSLLGLVPGGAEDLDVDYALSVDLVYIHSAHWLAHRFGWHRVMNHALLRQPQVANLPSWAPDWSVPCSREPEIDNSSEKLESLEHPPPLVPLRFQSRAMVFETFWDLDKPDGELQLGSRRELHLLATPALPLLRKAQGPSLYFPATDSQLPEILDQMFGPLTWNIRYLYSTYGEMIEPEKPEHGAPVVLKLVARGVGSMENTEQVQADPEHWQGITVEYLISALDASPHELIELIKAVFEDLVSNMVLPMESAAWARVKAQLGRNGEEWRSFSVRPRDYVKYIENIIDCIYAIFEEVGMGVEDIAASAMAVELLKANFMRDVREICIV